MATSEASVVDALGALHDCMEAVRLPLETVQATEGRAARREVLAQLDDYVIPRLEKLDAPLLAVIGGSTGAGKSTLVNALVGRSVSETGALRPTTRSPVLVHNPDDVEWFESDRILPNLPRATGSRPASDTRELMLRRVPDVPSGLALLDAPDIDSVVTQNRTLAAQLLAAADLWLFVTTAARYADAVPWELLIEAAQRSASVAVVLDRVPPDAIDAVKVDLARMLTRHGLGDSPLFVIPETTLEDGMLPSALADPIRGWLHNLTSDEAARAAVVRRTLDGALTGLLHKAGVVADAAEHQNAADTNLRAIVTEAYTAAVEDAEQAIGDGTLLRGEVLARWQDFVGTGDLIRSVQAQVGKLRDRLGAFLRGRPVPTEEVEVAIEHGVQAVLIEEANQAADRADTAWRAHEAGRALLDDGAFRPRPGRSSHEDLSRMSSDFPDRSAGVVRAWQGAVLELVRTAGADKRTTARVLSFGANGVGLALMIVVFSSTAGLSGAEVGIAAGTAVVSQKLLEAIFGDQAVRRLAEQARDDLGERAAELFAEESARFTDRLEALDLEPDWPEDLRGAVVEVKHAREVAA